MVSARNRSRLTLRSLLLLVLMISALAQSETVQNCILSGVGEDEPVTWDGSIEATGALILNVSGKRLGRDHSADESGWRLATGRVALTRGLTDVQRYPALETGVHVHTKTLGSDARFRVRTGQDEALFRAADVAFGNSAALMDGRVTVERFPVTSLLASSQEEQDLPATAVHRDTVHLAYVEFTHGDRSQRWRRQLHSEPDPFDPLARPAGGDRIWLREYSIPDDTWRDGGTSYCYVRSEQVDGEIVWASPMWLTRR